MVHIMQNGEEWLLILQFLPSGGLGRGPAHFGPAWAGFLPAHQGPEAHFGPNLALKIGPARPGPKI